MKRMFRHYVSGKFAVTLAPSALALTWGLLLGLGLPLWPTFGIIDSASAASVHHVPRDFSTIQAAVSFANPGDIIQVAPGTYNENITVSTPDIRLHTPDATLDGTGLDGNGIHLRDTNGVVVMGFVVENFENGIVLENAHDSRVHLNELRNNTSETMGLFTRNGILLDSANGNSVTNNYIHDNGHNGITLINASSNNTFRANTVVNNGTQVADGFSGCGIQTGGPGNNDNLIAENQFLGGATGVQGWGIQIGLGGATSGNVVRQNRSHENHRAGIALFGTASGNFIQQNNAKGNGLANIQPSFAFDLWDESGADNANTWQRNQGTPNF